MVTRVDPFLGGLGIDATGKFEVASNATVTIGNGTSTGNVNVGGEVVSSTVDVTTLKIGGTAVTATAAELNYVDGVTSSIQTQLDTKITGNQTITLSGDASGSGTTAITVTVADDSHNHIISNVDGLQTALDAKAPTAGPTFTGTLTYATLNDGTTTLTSTVAELNILDGVTSTAAELNVLDGITATVTELNYTDGVTSNIQTQLNARLPLAGGTMTGNIVMSGAQTVDGRDLSADGAKLDGIESGATADQTASEILTAIKTVDGAGSGLDADLLDGVSSASFLRSDTSDSFTSGTLTISGTSLRLNDSVEIEFGTGGGATDAQIAWSGTALEFDVNGGPLYLDMGNDNDFFIRDVNSSFAHAFAVDVSAGNATALTNVNANNGKLQEGGNSLIPPGSIIMYGAAAAPGGWYLCEGGAISRSTYAALFAVISTTYGVGDGSTTFNVPDFRDRAPYGASTFLLGTKTAGEVDVNGQNSTGTGTSGSSGATTVANTTGAGGAHTPGVTTSTTNSTTDKDVTNSITVVTAVSAVSDHTHTIPSLTVNGHTHSVPALTVTHPGVAVKFIIKT